MIETSWWSSPIRRTHEIGAVNIDLLFLGQYRDLQLEIAGLQHNSGGTSDVVMQFSTDNGATWDVTAGNYINVCDPTPAIAGVPLIGTLASLTSFSGKAELHNFNTPYPCGVLQRMGRLASNTAVRTGPTFHSTLVARNAIRIIAASAFTMNLGVILRTRRL